MFLSTDSQRYYNLMPKVELHIHLEESIPLPALWKLMNKYGGDPEIKNMDDLKKKFVYINFPHFIDTWIWKNQYLREYEDFTFIAEKIAKDLVKQNVVYAEMIHSPSDFLTHGLKTQDLVLAIRKGFDRVPAITINLVTDLIRDFGPKNGLRTLDKITEVKEAGIVGITIGGSEQKFPPEPYKPIYKQARAAGFRTSAHAGEAAGPESIRGAIHSLEVDRIGHGTAIRHESGLLNEIRSKGIAIEVCVLSNLRTGSIPSVGDHPVRQIADFGIPISINTDDPKMFGNSLLDEYQVLESEFGFTGEEILKIQHDSVFSCWANTEIKQAILDELNRFSD